MVLVDEKGLRVFRIESLCPLCDRKFHHVNALDTTLREYYLFCLNSRCRFVLVYHLE